MMIVIAREEGGYGRGSRDLWQCTTAGRHSPCCDVLPGSVACERLPVQMVDGVVYKVVE